MPIPETMHFQSMMYILWTLDFHHYKLPAKVNLMNNNKLLSAQCQIFLHYIGSMELNLLKIEFLFKVHLENQCVVSKELKDQRRRHLHANHYSI